jgi:glycosyltransferase involved in cell wall biosynthesis
VGSRVFLDGKKTLFVTELSGAGDEGMRNWVKMAVRALQSHGHEAELLRLSGDPRWASLAPSAWRSLRRARPDVLVYVPYSGLTSKALIRHVALRTASAASLDVLATLQSAPVVWPLPRPLAPALGAYISERLRAAHSTVARTSCVLPPAIDTARFRPAEGHRAEIRESLGFPSDKPLALHVGHLRGSRGLEALIELAGEGSVNVVLVASVVQEPDAGLEAQLRRANILVKREFIPDIQRCYQSADVYVFPVTNTQGSIEIPLSVLEAMACGVPVATTPFGGLPSLFVSSECLRFSPHDRLAETASQMVGVDGLANRSALIGMDEASFGRALTMAIEHAASDRSAGRAMEN